MSSRLLLGILGILRPIRAVLLPPSCRFHPTCSAYAVEALERHPLRPALSMILRRIFRCHPYEPGGYDPVRPATEPVREGVPLPHAVGRRPAEPVREGVPLPHAVGRRPAEPVRDG